MPPRSGTLRRPSRALPRRSRWCPARPHRRRHAARPDVDVSACISFDPLRAAGLPRPARREATRPRERNDKQNVCRKSGGEAAGPSGEAGHGRDELIRRVEGERNNAVNEDGELTRRCPHVSGSYACRPSPGTTSNLPLVMHSRSGCHVQISGGRKTHGQGWGRRDCATTTLNASDTL